MIENIKPLLIARGWLDAEPGNSKESVDLRASAEDAVEPVGISVQIHDWTVITACERDTLPALRCVLHPQSPL